MNIEAPLIEWLGKPANKLHTARSRNVQIVTDLRLSGAVLLLKRL